MSEKEFYFNIEDNRTHDRSASYSSAMTASEPCPFEPDWFSPPGETIEDLLEEREWTKREFATRMGVTPKHVNELLRGRAPLTSETADRLSTVLGSTPEFWLNREAQYRAAQYRAAQVRRTEEIVDRALGGYDESIDVPGLYPEYILDLYLSDSCPESLCDVLYQDHIRENRVQIQDLIFLALMDSFHERLRKGPIEVNKNV